MKSSVVELSLVPTVSYIFSLKFEILTEGNGTITLTDIILTDFSANSSEDYIKKFSYFPHANSKIKHICYIH